MISDRTKQLVEKFIQEGRNSPVRGWSMTEVLEKVKKVKGSVSQAREYIIDKYYAVSYTHLTLPTTIAV